MRAPSGKYEKGVFGKLLGPKLIECQQTLVALVAMIYLHISIKW